MSASAAYAQPRSLARVLIVEDDVAVAESLAEVLRDEGYDAFVAGDGRQALDWLERNAPPELILLDLWMPVLSGEEFRREQLALPALASIPVVVISAAADARARAAAIGAVGLLPKPIDLDRLLEVVQRYGVH